MCSLNSPPTLDLLRIIRKCHELYNCRAIHRYPMTCSTIYEMSTSSALLGVCLHRRGLTAFACRISRQIHRRHQHNSIDAFLLRIR